MDLLAITTLCGFIFGVFPIACSQTCDVTRVHISLIAEIHQGAECNGKGPLIPALAMVLAAEYAVQQLSVRNMTVPGLQYNLMINDICENRNRAVKLVAENVPMSALTGQPYCESRQNDMKSLLLGFVGPMTSSNAKDVSLFLNATNIPIISPSATSSSLSDKIIYQTFFRTASSDSLQAKLLAELALEMSWSYVMLVYSTDEYGYGCAEDVRRHLRQKGICISTELKIDSMTDLYLAATVVANDPAKGIILIAQQEPALSLISNYLSLSWTPPRKTILATDAVGTSQTVIDVFKRSTQPSQPLAIVTIAAYPTTLSGYKDYVRMRIQTSSGNSTSDGLIQEMRSQCPRSDPTCKDNSLIEQCDYIIHTMNSVLFLSQAFKLTYQGICPEDQTCNIAQNVDDLYKLLMGNLQTEQLVTVDNKMSKFNRNGDIEQDPTRPTYTIQVLNKQGFKNFTQVALYYGSTGLLNFTNREVLLSYAGSSHCSANCVQCQQLELPSYVFTKGTIDYVIIGTGPISESKNSYDCGPISELGIVRMEAFYFGMEVLKNKTGLDFSLLFIDTCYAEFKTYAVLAEIFSNTTHATVKDESGVVINVPIEKIILAIGDMSSTISMAIQTYLKPRMIPQISYGSTSVWLSDRLRYPSFLRVVPPDSEQARMIIEVAKRLNLTNLGVIHSSSTYGATGYLEILKAARAGGICISYTKETNGSSSSVSTIANDLTNRNLKTLPKGFIYFGEEDHIKKILEELSIKDQGSFSWSKMGGFFMGSETWGKSPSVISTSGAISAGSLTMELDPQFSWKTEDDENLFNAYLKTRKPYSNRYNPWFSAFWQSKFDCFLDLTKAGTYGKQCSTECNLVDASQGSCGSQSIFVDDMYAVNIVKIWYIVSFAIADVKSQGLCKQSDCSDVFEAKDGRNLFLKLLKTSRIPSSLNGLLRDVQPFNDNGDGYANYLVNNLVKKRTSPSHDKLDYTRVLSISNGELTELIPPVHYADGTEEVQYVSDCPDKRCRCLEQTHVSYAENSSEAHSLTIQDQDKVLLISILWAVVLVIVVIICTTWNILLHCYYHRRKADTKLNKTDEIDARGDIGSFSSLSSNTQSSVVEEPRAISPPSIPSCTSQDIRMHQMKDSPSCNSSSHYERIQRYGSLHQRNPHLSNTAYLHDEHGGEGLVSDARAESRIHGLPSLLSNNDTVFL